MLVWSILSPFNPWRAKRQQRKCLRLFSAKYSLLFPLASNKLVCKGQGDSYNSTSASFPSLTLSNEAVILVLKLPDFLPKISFLLCNTHFFPTPGLVQSLVPTPSSIYLFPLEINLAVAKVTSEPCTLLPSQILYLASSTDTWNPSVSPCLLDLLFRTPCVMPCSTSWCS